MSSSSEKEKHSPSDPEADIERHDTADVSVYNGYDSDMFNDLPPDKDLEWKRLARKVDWVLLPLMWAVYGFQGQDKSSIASQAIFGLRDDLHMHGQQYQFLSTIFSIALLVGTVPSLLLLQRVRIGLVLNTYMTAWGVMALCSGFVQTWSQLMAIRAIQGWFESVCHPAMIILTSQYYPQREHGTRSLLWQSSSYCFSIIVSFVEYGLGKQAYDHPEGIHAWRSICFFLGSGTLFVSILCWYFLGSPENVSWLTARQKKMVAARTIGNKSGRSFQTSDIDWSQVRETFKDVQLWILVLHTITIYMTLAANSGYSRILYTSFGFTPLEVMLIDTPRPAIAIFIVAGSFFYLKKFSNHRLIVMTSMLSVTIAGYIVLVVTSPDREHKWIRWTGFVMTVTAFLSASLGWSLVASNFAGKTRKAVVLAVCFLAYCVGITIGSQIFQTKDAPRYIPAYVTLSCLVTLDMIILTAWRLNLGRQNKKRDQAALAMDLTPAEQERIGQELGEQDVTDKNNPHFRYAT